MRISDWSSDVCSSDLHAQPASEPRPGRAPADDAPSAGQQQQAQRVEQQQVVVGPAEAVRGEKPHEQHQCGEHDAKDPERQRDAGHDARSEEQTSELQSLMRISSAVFCLKTKKNAKNNTNK